MKELEKTANQIRQTILKSIAAAGSGHPGGSLSGADIVTALYFDIMDIDPKNPKKEDRDKFVLSKGHAAPLLYSALGHRGFFPLEQVMGLRKINGKFQGHPDKNKVPGVEMSTGSLGQGFSTAIGMALANKVDKKNNKVYVLLGDGELQEGIVWEAAMAANHYSLANLVAIVDWNGLQIDGKNEDVMTVAPIKEKFQAFGWKTMEIDGHNMKEILESLKKAKEEKEKPTVIVAKTHKGQGVSFMADNPGWHGKAPNEEQLTQALKELGGEDNDR